MALPPVGRSAAAWRRAARWRCWSVPWPASPCPREAGRSATSWNWHSRHYCTKIALSKVAWTLLSGTTVFAMEPCVHPSPMSETKLKLLAHGKHENVWGRFVVQTWMCVHRRLHARAAAWLRMSIELEWNISRINELKWYFLAFYRAPGRSLCTIARSLLLLSLNSFACPYLGSD